MIEPLLLSTARVNTFSGTQLLSEASGFFFGRDERLFFVTSRHVLVDPPSGHHPDRIEIELHTDAQNLTQSAVMLVPLYRDGTAAWHEGSDAGGHLRQRHAAPHGAPPVARPRCGFPALRPRRRLAQQPFARRAV